MKIVDRINAWAVNRLPSRRQTLRLTAIDPFGLIFEGPAAASGQTARHIRWSSIDRVVGTTASSLAGDTIVLLFSLVEGHALTISEDTAVFSELTEKLHLHLRGARRFADWSLELVRFGGDSVEIYRRD